MYHNGKGAITSKSSRGVCPRLPLGSFRTLISEDFRTGEILVQLRLWCGDWSEAWGLACESVER